MPALLATPPATVQAAPAAETQIKLLARFQNDDGKQRLLCALRMQEIVSDESQLADELGQVATLASLNNGDHVIEQGAADTDICLILAGRVSIRINGREVARRSSGQHVGEMALIDPTARRSATVVALEETVIARVPEPAFTGLAVKYPRLWRRLALELADRLRQRGTLVTPVNAQPHLFIGSTVEALPIARELQSCFTHDPLVVRVWTDGIFKASAGPAESLLQAVKTSDFAALVLTADDMVLSRNVQQLAPRDNCIFELGLFMGALGRERTYILKPRGQAIKWPTDFLGLTPIEYTQGPAETLTPRVSTVANEIRKLIGALGPK